jgi:heme exporter protein A
MMTALIVARGLTKAYDLLPVLRRIDLDIARGECVALLGANGSGKSTLLRLLSGLSKPSSGEITVGGWQLPREAAAVRGQIGMVGHKGLLYENLSARENLQFFARLYNLPSPEREARVESLLRRVGLGRRADDRVRGFSRGMQQRLSIARALLHEPDVLLLDEPYTGLDQDGAALLDDLIAEGRAAGRTILLSTHDLERASMLAARALILASGRIAYDGAVTGGAALIERYAAVTGAASGQPV